MSDEASEPTPPGQEPTPPDHELTPPDQELADRLSTQRPIPEPEFRGALRQHLATRDPGYGSRPPRLRSIVSAYIGAGAVALALGALEAVGVL